MTIRNAPTDLKTLLARMKNMLGHVGRRDRDVVNEACEALVELARRLHAVKTTGVDPDDLPALEDRADYVPADTRGLGVTKIYAETIADELGWREHFRQEQHREDETTVTPGTRLDA